MNHDYIEFRHLRYFVAVAEAGNFNRAADRLGVSQPNISMQIRDLESTLRVELVQRRGRRILVTLTGQILLAYARSMLEQLESFYRELEVEPGEMRGVLHLGVVPILNLAVIPQLLEAFAANHPRIDLKVEEISSTEIETALEEGRINVGLGFLTRHSPNLRYERLCIDRFAVIVDRNHPWAKRRAVAISKLHRERIIQLPDSFVMRRMTDAIWREHHIRPRTVAQINTIETLLCSLASLKAAALMPRIALRRDSDLIAIPLQGKNLRIEVGLLRLIDSGNRGLVAEFAKLARSAIPRILRRNGMPNAG